MEFVRGYESVPPISQRSDQRSLPDIERNGHHGVENDEVGPEYEDGRHKRRRDVVSPRQDVLEGVASLALPDAVPDGEAKTH